MPGKSKKFARNSVASQESKKSGLTKANGAHKRKSRADEELSDQTDEEDGGVDDMDLRANIDDDPGASGEEDENETPAEKRLRLAQLYLNSVKADLGEPHLGLDYLLLISWGFFIFYYSGRRV